MKGGGNACGIPAKPKKQFSLVAGFPQSPKSSFSPLRDSRKAQKAVFPHCGIPAKPKKQFSLVAGLPQSPKSSFSPLRESRKHFQKWIWPLQARCKPYEGLFYRI